MKDEDHVLRWSGPCIEKISSIWRSGASTDIYHNAFHQRLFTNAFPPFTNPIPNANASTEHQTPTDSIHQQLNARRHRPIHRRRTPNSSLQPLRKPPYTRRRPRKTPTRLTPNSHRQRRAPSSQESKAQIGDTRD